MYALCGLLPSAYLMYSRPSTPAKSHCSALLAGSKGSWHRRQNQLKGSYDVETLKAPIERTTLSKLLIRADWRDVVLRQNSQTSHSASMSITAVTSVITQLTR
ncbi:hypothetical protein M758_1G192300 [Ceratodon purpureus]|nr:hypothetical protein M758_1G192300 [Ceratodon purpureus]